MCLSGRPVNEGLLGDKVMHFHNIGDSHETDYKKSNGQVQEHQ